MLRNPQVFLVHSQSWRSSYIGENTEDYLGKKGTFYSDNLFVLIFNVPVLCS